MNLSSESKRQLIYLEDYLNGKILGQRAAVSSVSSYLKRGECGLAVPNQPLGSFLFLGPTGVGKTQLTKEFCGYLFGNEALAAFDMSEYQRPTAVRQLLGSDVREGRLHDSLLRGSKKKVILFDEIEKAHPLFRDLLLQMLAEGRVTLGSGEVIDLQPYYIVLTSNLASEAILKAQKGSQASLRRFVEAAAQRFLRPELLGRIDLVEVFQPIAFTDRVRIGRMLVDAEVDRLEKLGEHPSKLFDDTLLAMCALDGNLGIRPLRRKIQGILQNDLIFKELAI